MKYHTLFVIFEKEAKFETVTCCKLQVALYGSTHVALNPVSVSLFQNSVDPDQLASDEAS